MGGSASSRNFDAAEEGTYPSQHDFRLAAAGEGRALTQRAVESAALATCELKFNFDFYRAPSVSRTPFHFFANAIADQLRIEAPPTLA